MENAYNVCVYYGFYWENMIRSIATLIFYLYNKKQKQKKKDAININLPLLLLLLLFQLTRRHSWMCAVKKQNKRQTKQKLNQPKFFKESNAKRDEKKNKKNEKTLNESR